MASYRYIQKPEPNNSFGDLHPELIKEWNYSKNEGLTPFDIKPKCNKHFWWVCSKCGHEWQVPAHHRSYGWGCPCCASKVVKAGYNDLLSQRPDIARDWHPTKNGILTPDQITPGSHTKVWWKCKRGHEWETTPLHRTSTNGTGCPYCTASSTSYPEQYLYWALKQIYPNTLNRFKTKNSVEYDIYVPDIRLAIEYSGSHWHE